MKQIAHIETVYKSKFGVPRQAGLVDTSARVVFEPEYRVAEALRGLEDFEYIWLLWGFHLAKQENWRPTVRPPRLGGNKRVGVFATRSPFRPNPIGLSSVRLLRIERDESLGMVLVVAGADLVDGTPIYDIKPYLPYADSHPEARAGFAAVSPTQTLKVVISESLLSLIPKPLQSSLIDTIALDPRPHYHADPQRTYAMSFDQYEVYFRVNNDVATVEDVVLNSVKAATNDVL